jgi:hypothetical protein
MKALVRVGLVSLLAFAVHASAENRVCIGGDLDHLTEAQKSGCWDIAHQVRSDAAKFNPPADWHFFVICTDSDWKAYAAFSKRSAADLATMNADTDVQQRVTFLRGARLMTADASGLDKILAHEVASALLESTDETRIKRQVAVLLQENDKTAPTSPTLLASR